MPYIFQQSKSHSVSIEYLLISSLFRDEYVILNPLCVLPEFIMHISLSPVTGFYNDDSGKGIN